MIHSLFVIAAILAGQWYAFKLRQRLPRQGWHWRAELAVRRFLANLLAQWRERRRLAAIRRNHRHERIAARINRAYEMWMVWRIRPARAWISDKTTCRACGKRAQHPYEFHPPSKKLVACCIRCKATYPMDPIYATDGWLPAMPMSDRKD